MKSDSYWSKMALHKVPSEYLLMSAFISYLILALSWLQGVPIWIAFAMALVPWGIMMFVEVTWAYRHFHWLALFFLMAFVQTIHYSEHLIEVIQYNFLGDSYLSSIAIFSKLNIEWVHFLGDSFLIVATLFLLYKVPYNKWLWPAAIFGILHTAEHTFLLVNYLFSHVPGGAEGMLASPGGFIFGGVGLNRQDLHFIYNTLYTIPLVAALIWQLNHSYDTALDEAFPDEPKEALVEAARHLTTFTYKAAETVVAPGDDADRLYVITEGSAGVYRHNPDGTESEVAVLHEGQYFGEIGLLVPGAPHTKIVRALTPLSVLCMGEQTFRQLIADSQQSGEELLATARARMATAPAS